MKLPALLIAGALLASTTQAAEPEATANVYVKDQRFRLVAVDGNKIMPHASQQYRVQAGARTLELQRMIPSATAPGKSIGYQATPKDKFVTLNTHLAADGNYVLHSGKPLEEPVPVITQVGPTEKSSALSMTYNPHNSAVAGFGETP